MENLFIDHDVFYIKYDSLSVLELFHTLNNSWTGELQCVKLVVAICASWTGFFLLYHLRFYRMLVFNPGRRVSRTLFLDRLWLRRKHVEETENCTTWVWWSELKAQRVIGSLAAHRAWLVWNWIENIASKFQARKIWKTCLAARLPGLFEWILFLEKPHAALHCRSLLLSSFSICLFKCPIYHIETDLLRPNGMKNTHLCCLSFQSENNDSF